MCGIAGFIGFRQGADQAKETLAKMVSTIAHRGPDDDGFFVDGTAALGMRRLSIIDLEGGKQPIFSPDGKRAIVFNGEIYNYRELRAELVERGHTFTTRSDTEVILRLYEERGPRCLDALQGMFTIAIYEIPERRLFLARDRLGVKPLYVWQKDDKLAFGSEIKSLLRCPEIGRKIDPEALDLYLSYRYVPGPRTMFRGITKFPAAHYAIYEKGALRFERYWMPPVYTGTYSRDDREYQARFDELFEASVRKRMVSDVPVGAFLSGGVDSSAIVAAMSRTSSEPVRTFSVGFEWEGDELKDARRVAEHLGCKHEEVTCRTSDMELLPRIVWHLDEPIGDAICVPMYLLSKSASRQVKVILSGEGADEVLAGYFPHRVLHWSSFYDRMVPRVLQRNLVRPAVSAVPSRLLGLAFDYPAELGERGKRKLLDYLAQVERGGLYSRWESLLSLFGPEDKSSLYTPEFRRGLAPRHKFPDHPYGKSGSALENILSLQYLHWLQDDILNKQDKMTMANGVEGREPFMDHLLVEFLATVPPRLKLGARSNKILLRNYLRKVLPEEVSRRPKKAFYVPTDKYLGSPQMREMIEVCLSEETVKKRGCFRPEAVRQLRERARRGEFIDDKQVFSLLMLELWNRMFIDRDESASLSAGAPCSL
jgi:asparagine synthase (glutamine-hydrolysing)